MVHRHQKTYSLPSQSLSNMHCIASVAHHPGMASCLEMSTAIATVTVQPTTSAASTTSDRPKRAESLQSHGLAPARRFRASVLRFQVCMLRGREAHVKT